jgi:hypothetical protein
LYREICLDASLKRSICTTAAFRREGRRARGGGGGGYRERCNLLGLAENFDVPQLVEVEVPLPLQSVNFELHTSSLQVGALPVSHFWSTAREEARHRDCEIERYPHRNILLQHSTAPPNTHGVVCCANIFSNTKSFGSPDFTPELKYMALPSPQFIVIWVSLVFLLQKHRRTSISGTKKGTDNLPV